jgi:hypothetical protein
MLDELYARLLDLAGKWVEVAEEAKERAGSGETDTLPPYYYGVAFGLETAAEELQALVDQEKEQ